MKDVSNSDKPANRCNCQPVIIGQQSDDVVEMRWINRAMINYYELSCFVFDHDLLNFFKALTTFEG